MSTRTISPTDDYTRLYEVSSDGLRPVDAKKAPRIPQPVTAAPSVDIKHKVIDFMESSKTTMVSVLLRTGATVKAVVTRAKPASIVDAAPFATGIVATQPGYHLTVGATELVASTGQAYITGTIHGFNKVFTPVMWVGAQAAAMFGDQARKDAVETVYQISQDIATFAEDVDRGLKAAVDTGVDVLRDDTTSKVVTTGSAVLTVGIIANGLTRGWLTRAIERVPSVGGGLASAFKGGKGTWAALGLLFVVGVGATIGRKVYQDSLDESRVEVDGQQELPIEEVYAEEAKPTLGRRTRMWLATKVSAAPQEAAAQETAVDNVA